MKTGVVILNYNNAEDTISCIKSLYAHTPLEKIKVVVVDNGSNETTVTTIKEFISRYTPSVTLLETDKNLGYALGNNFGCQYLYKDKNIDTIAIVNNDTIFIQDIITPLVEKLNTIPDCAIISPLLLCKDGKTIDTNCARKAETLGQIFISWALLFRNSFGILSRIKNRRSMLPKRIYGEVLPIELPSGSCMVCRKSLFESIGSFDPNTFLYYEENILWEKIKALGLKNYIDTSVRLIHIGAATTSTKTPSALVARSLVHSTRYFIKNYTEAGFIYRATMEILFCAFRLKIAIKTRLKK